LDGSGQGAKTELLPVSRLFGQKLRGVRELTPKEGTKISASAWTFALSFLVAIALVIASNIWLDRMLEEVNQRLPREEEIEFVGRWNMYKVLSLHSEMYPDSPKRRQMWALCLLAAAFGFGGFVASWFLPH
jgi:hypothetical protein